MHRLINLVLVLILGLAKPLISQVVTNQIEFEPSTLSTFIGKAELGYLFANVQDLNDPSLYALTKEFEKKLVYTYDFIITNGQIIYAYQKDDTIIILLNDGQILEYNITTEEVLELHPLLTGNTAYKSMAIGYFKNLVSFDIDKTLYLYNVDSNKLLGTFFDRDDGFPLNLEINENGDIFYIIYYTFKNDLRIIRYDSLLNLKYDNSFELESRPGFMAEINNDKFLTAIIDENNLIELFEFDNLGNRESLFKFDYDIGILKDIKIHDNFLDVISTSANIMTSTIWSTNITRLDKNYNQIFLFKTDKDISYENLIYDDGDIIFMGESNYSDFLGEVTSTVIRISDILSSIDNLKIEEANHYKVSPNPSSSFVKLYPKYNKSDIVIFNLKGEITLKSVINNSIDIKNLENGIYYLYDHKDKEFIGKFIKN